VTCYK